MVLGPVPAAPEATTATVVGLPAWRLLILPNFGEPWMVVTWLSLGDAATAVPCIVPDGNPRFGVEDTVAGCAVAVVAA